MSWRHTSCLPIDDCSLYYCASWMRGIARRSKAVMKQLQAFRTQKAYSVIKFVSPECKPCSICRPHDPPIESAATTTTPHSSATVSAYAPFSCNISSHLQLPLVTEKQEPRSIGQPPRRAERVPEVLRAIVVQVVVTVAKRPQAKL